MCFDVPKVVRSPGCDHGHDEESRNGRDLKIDILDIVFGLRKGSGIHRKGFRMFSEMFGYENTLFGPTGFWKAQKEVLRSPGTRRQGPWRLGPDAGYPGVWPWSPRRTLAFQVKPTL